MRTVTAPPSLVITDAVRMLGLRLRVERDTDLPFVRRLYVSTRWQELAGVEWPDDAKLAFLEQQFRYQREHYQRYYVGAEFSIVEQAGIDVGRLYVFRGAAEIRIVDIAFLPEWCGKGFGTALMEALFVEGDARAAGVSVNVEVFNPARRLYARLGFHKVAEHGPYLFLIRPPRRGMSQLVQE